MAANAPRFEVYLGEADAQHPNPWRLRLIAANGEIVAQGQAYTRKEDAVRACNEIKRIAAAADVAVKE